MRPSSFSFVSKSTVQVGESIYHVRIVKHPSGKVVSVILNAEGVPVFAQAFVPSPGRKGGRPRSGVRDLLRSAGLIAPDGTRQESFPVSNRGKAPKEG